MTNLSISKITNINPVTIREVLSSAKISRAEKIQFMKNNSTEIKSVLDIIPTNSEYNALMKERPLVKFKPLKNSFTKRGDKILLAKTLNISLNEVDNYIKNVHDSLKKTDNLDFLPTTTIDSIKTYIYRHGSAEQLVSFFNFELSKSEDKLKLLYHTLEYNNCGIADYFIRPIHRMKNTTLIDLYNVIDKNLKMAYDNHQITQEQNLAVSEWALKRIYQIQHNSKFINAIKIKQYV